MKKRLNPVTGVGGKVGPLYGPPQTITGLSGKSSPVRVQGPMLGGRDKGAHPTAPKPPAPKSNRGSRGNRGKTVIHSGAAPAVAAAPKAPTLGGAAHAGSPPPPAGAPAAKQPTLADHVDQIIRDSIAQNDRATGAYQTQNKSLRDQLAASAQQLAGTLATPVLAANYDPTLGGSGNRDTATNTGLANNVASAQTNALRDYLTAHANNTSGYLASLADAQNARGVEYTRSLQGQRQSMIDQEQAAQDKQALELQKFALAAQIAGDTASARNYQNQIAALRANNDYNLGVARIDSSNANAAARNKLSATKYGLALSQKQNAAASKILGGLIKYTKVGTIKSADGSTQDDLRTVISPMPLRTALSQMTAAGISPDLAAQLTTRALLPHRGQIGTFKQGHATGYYNVLTGEFGVSPQVALALTRSSFGIPKWSPVAGPLYDSLSGFKVGGLKSGRKG